MFRTRLRRSSRNLDRSDKNFMRNLLISYRNRYNYIMTKSVIKYKFFLKETHLKFNFTKIKAFNKETKTYEKYTFIPIGYHKNNKFIWRGSMNDIILNKLKNMQFMNSISLKLINKIFAKKCKFSNRYKKIIPYIVSISNPKFNLIQFTNNNIMFYSLINLNIN